MDQSQQQDIFDEWLQAHKGILFKIIRAYAFNPYDQDDLFQEITLQLWQSIPEFRGEAKASTWIYRVALYTASVWARKERREPPAEDLADYEHNLLVAAHNGDERLDWLYEQIGGLEPIDRSVCLLLLDGFSYQEMAAMLGISESHVGVKVHRLKQQLIRKTQESAHEL